MRERVALAVLAEQPSYLELLEGGHGLLVATPARLADRLQVEGRSEHRGCREHLASPLARRRRPVPQELGHALRHVATRRLAESREVLDDEERQAGGLGVEPIDLRCGARCPCQLRYGRATEASRSHEKPPPRAPCVCQQLAECVARRQLLGSPRQQDAERAALEASHQEAQHLERRGIDPLSVVHDEKPGRECRRYRP